MARPESIPPSSGNDAVDRVAAAWLAERDTGLSAPQAAEFARWRAADPRHSAAFRRAEAAQHLLARLPESPAAAALFAEVDELYRSRRRIHRFVTPWKIAAGLAIAASLVLVLWLPSRTRALEHATYATMTGQHQSIDLPDGSTLVLNGDSAVEVAFVPEERRVQLQRGEAHFYVAKNAGRPFLVGAGLVTVRAVGTAFNVHRDAAAVEVLVTEGKVKVFRTGPPAAGAAAAEPLFLVAGQRAVIDGTSAAQFARDTVAPVNAADSAAQPSHAPRLLFSDTPLSDVVARFNTYSHVQMEIADPELARRSVGGNFDADNAEAFINLLIAAGDVRVERASPTRVVLHKVP